MRVQKIHKSKLIKLNKWGTTHFQKELKDLNTFRINGKAKIYMEIGTIENFLDVLQYIQSCHERIFILGGGSNILVGEYFDGVVIKLVGDFDRIEIIDDVIEMGAGVRLISALQFCIDKNLAGFEESIGIPGTIGGATYMNASCYNFEMAKIVNYVVAYNLHTGKITYLNNSSCSFDYRKSIFQNDNFVILRVGFKLNSCPKEVLEEKKKEIIAMRNNSQPKGYSAGSVFKKIDNLNVSKMLDDMGIKGRCVGGAEVSIKHANFILNTNNATSAEVKSLIESIQKDFEDKYNLKLQREIKYLE